MVNQWSQYIPKFGAVSEPGRGPGTYSGYGGAGAYFGSLRGRVPDVAKYLKPGGFADQVAASVGPARAPHFDTAAIRRSLEGPAGVQEGLARERGIYGSANLFSSGRAAAAGIPGGVGQHLTKIVTAGGHKMTVNAEAAPHFKQFVEDLEHRGYNIRDLGSLAIRGKRGGGGMSEHAFGNAIDINPAQNPFHSSRTDLPKGVEDIAAKYGLTWGGTWRPGSKDPMHFEWTGKPTIPEPQIAASDRNAITDAAAATRETAAMHGDALRKHFGVGHRSEKRADMPDLLGGAQRAGIMGSTQHTVKGRAALDISLNGFPKGTVSKSRTDGDLFKETRVVRGRAAPLARMDG
jgi:hypothetical protein